MSRRLLTVEDAISTLSHSSLPSLVVEGGSDVIVLRRLERMISGAELSVFPVGGRDTVLGVFERRAELGAARCILFFVDSDLWIYSGTPSEFQHDDLLTTIGYSIENDMYVDGDLERLLTGKEAADFQNELGHFVDWFSNQISLFLNGHPCQVALHPNQVLQQPRPAVNDQNLRNRISADYPLMLRGHSLFALLLRQLSHAKRASKYSAENLLELGATAAGNRLIRISNWITERFQVHGCI